MLYLPKKFADQIIAQCKAEAPNEACGLLAGQNSRVSRVLQMMNAERSPVIFRMDPKEQLRAFQEIDEDGLELVAIYHSHTRSPAYPSATDVEWAYYPEAITLIVSLASEPSTLRCFNIIEKRISEVPLKIEREAKK